MLEAAERQDADTSCSDAEDGRTRMGARKRADFRMGIG